MQFINSHALQRTGSTEREAGTGESVMPEIFAALRCDKRLAVGSGLKMVRLQKVCRTPVRNGFALRRVVFRLISEVAAMFHTNPLTGRTLRFCKTGKTRAKATF